MPVNVAQISRTVVRRAWHDIEPKIQAGLLTGAFVTALIAEAGSAGIDVSPTLAALLTAAASFAGGWLKSSDARDWSFGGLTEQAPVEFLAPVPATAAAPAPAADFTA